MRSSTQQYKKIKRKQMLRTITQPQPQYVLRPHNRNCCDFQSILITIKGNKYSSHSLGATAAVNLIT